MKKHPIVTGLIQLALLILLYTYVNSLVESGKLTWELVGILFSILVLFVGFLQLESRVDKIDTKLDSLAETLGELGTTMNRTERMVEHDFDRRRAEEAYQKHLREFAEQMDEIRAKHTRADGPESPSKPPDSGSSPE